MLAFPNSQNELQELASWKFTTAREMHERVFRVVNSILEKDGCHPWILVGATDGGTPVVTQLADELFTLQGERGLRLAIHLEVAAMRSGFTALSFGSPLPNYSGPNGVRLITVGVGSTPSLSEWMCRANGPRVLYAEESPLPPARRVAEHFRNIFPGAGDRTASFFRGKWTDRD